MCNPYEEHGRETAQAHLDAMRGTLADTPSPEARAWDGVLRQDARRVLVELAGLPAQTKAVAWGNLTEGERRQLRAAIQRARTWADSFRSPEGVANA